MPEKPNVILAFVDQWRSDCLSIAGHPVVHTPYLDQMASRGARVTAAYSAVSTCIAARAALFTGMHQKNHGRVGYKDGVPWDYENYLAGCFTDAGYQTQAVGKMHVYPERTQCGFQNVKLHDGFLHFGRKVHDGWMMKDDYLPWLNERLGRPADYFEHGINCNSNVARPWDKEEYLHPSNWVAHQSIDFLRSRDPRKPFFLFMSFHRPHPPYDPPQWAFDMYKDVEMPPVPVGEWAACYDERRYDHDPESTFSKVRPDILQRARAGYYGHMTHIDHQINRFMEALPEHGVDPDNTWVVFTADHGELMGDHNMWRKAYPYEGATHIPFIIRGPRDCGFEWGTTSDIPIELMDVMPTLLDAAGISIPDSVDGRSILPALRGEETEWREFIQGEHASFDGAAMYLTDGKEKYIWFSETGREQFFNLADDPQELNDLICAPAWSERISNWRARLVSELAGREEGFSDGENLIAGRPNRSVLSFLHQS